MEHENSYTSLHESQLAAAKMEGKLQAAHTQIASLEKGNQFSSILTALVLLRVT